MSACEFSLLLVSNIDGNTVIIKGLSSAKGVIIKTVDKIAVATRHIRLVVVCVVVWLVG